MDVIGRQREMAGVDPFLDLLSGGPAALVLEGDPGIGKTTVWRAAVESARSRAYRVLICRASESEGALSFLGLGDLLEGVPDDNLKLLPEPQRAALESALRRLAEDDPPDRVNVARGALNVLRASAAETPTVVAVDDVQWLDRPSADVLRFAAHRLTDERLGLLVSARNGGASSLELDRAFPGVRIVRLLLEPLSFEELEDVVRLHLQVELTQPTWRALHRISGGNPFFALQLAEALERRGGRVSEEGLPIPSTLAEAMRERLAALSPDARSALLPVAALAQPTLSLVHAGAANADGIEEAVRAGVLQIDGERLRFAHPLLASFVYGDASDAERRAVHERLVALVADPEENALHLARGTVDPDESIAATLEAVAGQAARRGHPEIGAELAEGSARLTPAESAFDRARRIRTAAELLFAAGDGLRSRELLQELIAVLPRSTERAEVLLLLGGRMGNNIPHSIDQLEQAYTEAGADLELRAHILPLLSRMEAFRGHWDKAARRAREAVELAECSGSDAALAKALARSAWAQPTPSSLLVIERALELERSFDEPLPVGEAPRYVGGHLLLALDRLDEARHVLEETHEHLVARGDSWRSATLGHLAELELRVGHWDRALALARESADLARQWGTPVGESWALGSRALVEAHVGNSEAALGAGERASELARASGYHQGLVRSETALALLKSSTGDNAAALGHLLPLLEERGGASLWPAQEPRVLAQAIEALVATGGMEEAESLVDRLEERVRSLPLPSTMAASARCRALVFAERGDLSGARVAIENAFAAHADLAEPFEVARTHLAHGSIERRAKRKAEARAVLGRAEAIFAQLGARLWLERVRGDLARTGLTRSLDRELTETELRVAELAAAGKRNKEIASALFVSIKTVEANLSRVYAKLGVRSRVELASQLSKRDNANPAGRPSVERPRSIDIPTAQ